MKKQILACVLVVAMLIITFATNASAQKIDTSTVSGTTTVVQSGEPLIDGDFEYTTNEEGIVEITKYTGTGGDVVIPSTIEGKNVTQIGQYSFENCTGLTSITIPDTVTTIWWNAFEGCTALSNVTLPNSVTAIHRSAFRGCIGLSSIKIPASVTSIGERIFYGCTNLSEIKVSVDNPVFADYDGIICDKAIKTVLCCPEGKKGEIKLLDSVTKIDDNAFDSCLGFTSITIPASVTQIGNAAFYDCNNLADVYYSGDKESWEKISIDTGNDPLLNAKLHVENINKPYATIHGFELIYGLGCGESKTFTVRFNFNTDITSENYNFVYTSSNNSIATIHETKHDRISNYSVLSEVEVTGVSGGTAKLTVKETTTGSEESFDISVFNGSDFTIGKDNFSFTNSADCFYSNNELMLKSLPLKISDDVVKRLLNHTVDFSERQRLMNMQLCTANNGIWNGSCFGMSSSMAIKYIDSSRLPSRIIDEKKPPETIFDWKSPIKNQNTADVVNYYQMSQVLNHNENLKYTQLQELSRDYSKALDNLIKNINDTTVPVIGSLSYVKNVNGDVSQKNNHAILLLRVKEENKDYFLIECYDPNEMNSFRYLKLYKEPSEADDEYSNLFKIVYQSTSGQELNALATYYSGLSIIDKYNFLSETSGDGTSRITDVVTLSENSGFTVIADGNTVIDRGKPVNSSVYGPIPSMMGILSNSDESSIGSVSYYTDFGFINKCSLIHKETEKYGSAELALANHMFSITTTNSGTTECDDKTGNVNISMDSNSDYTLSVTDNNNICNWEWYTLTVNANNSKELSVKFTDNGILLSGDNLKNTEVKVNNTSDNATLTIDKNANNVMIQKSGTGITTVEVEHELANSSNNQGSEIKLPNTATNGNTSGNISLTNDSISNVTTGDSTKVAVFAILFGFSALVIILTVRRKKIILDN